MYKVLTLHEKFGLITFEIAIGRKLSVAACRKLRLLEQSKVEFWNIGELDTGYRCLGIGDQVEGL